MMQHIVFILGIELDSKQNIKDKNNSAGLFLILCYLLSRKENYASV